MKNCTIQGWFQYLIMVLLFGTINYKCIDDTQNQAVRFFLGIYKFAPLLGVEGEVAWVPSLLRRNNSMLSLWNIMPDKSDDNYLRLFSTGITKRKTIFGHIKSRNTLSV